MNKISVIIPCYNSSSTIERCIKSVQNQTYKNIEIIVVNDGSADSSPQIIQALAEKDSRIILINKENGGVGSARNLGLRSASGDYIQFVDSDDYIDSRMLETLAASLEKTGSDIAVCRFTHCCFKAFLPAGVYDMRLASDFSLFYKDFFTFNVPWNKLFRRSAITHFFDETLKIFEDGLFVLESLKNAGHVSVLGDELYHYQNAEDTAASSAPSAVNRFLKSKFWRTKQGYWYKFNEIKSKFDHLLPHFNSAPDTPSPKQNLNNLEYARSFDMAFWELIKLIDSGCDQRICTLEMFGIFNQSNFKKAVRAQGHNYGCASKKATATFVSDCFAEVLRTKNAGEGQVNVGILYNKIVQNFYDTCMPQKTATQAVPPTKTTQKRAYSVNNNLISDLFYTENDNDLISDIFALEN